MFLLKMLKRSVYLLTALLIFFNVVTADEAETPDVSSMVATDETAKSEPESTVPFDDKADNLFADDYNISTNYNLFFKSNEDIAGGYVLGPGDVLTINVYNVEKLSGEYHVRYDGNVDFPYIGEVRAAGIPLADFNATLERRLGEVYNEPELICEISDYKSCQVYVLGEVKSPGLYKYEATATVLEIITLANGYSNSAARSSTMLIRPFEGEPAILRVDMEKVIDEGVIALNVAVKPGDIIVVPKTFVANLNQFLADITPSLFAYTRINSAYRTNWER